MDDIVTRLRADAKNLEDRLAFFEARRHTEVADEIERLRKENAELMELWQKEVEDNRW